MYHKTLNKSKRLSHLACKNKNRNEKKRQKEKVHCSVKNKKELNKQKIELSNETDTTTSEIKREKLYCAFGMAKSSPRMKLKKRVCIARSTHVTCSGIQKTKYGEKVHIAKPSENVSIET